MLAFLSKRNSATGPAVGVTVGVLVGMEVLVGSGGSVFVGERVLNVSEEI